MIGKKLLETKPVTISQVEGILKKRQESAGLNYEQELTQKYIAKFKKLESKEAEKAVKELIEAGLDEASAVKVVDIMPKTLDELKAVFGKRPMPEDVLAKSFEVVQKHK